MSVTKNAKIIYVEPIPKERSGIGCDVPAHVKIQWLDEQGRYCTMELGLADGYVARVAALPDQVGSAVQRLTSKPDILCNLCGLTCVLGTGSAAYREMGGLIQAKVCGGYESTPGNGHGALDDTERYTFSLCEFCIDWLFARFKIPVAVDSYMDGLCPREWTPAAERVEQEDWRKMKAEFRVASEERARARGEDKRYVALWKAARSLVEIVEWADKNKDTISAESIVMDEVREALAMVKL